MMIKKPGTFSNKYMSNPLPAQHSFVKEKNKQNKNPNSTLEQHHIHQQSNSSLSETKVQRRDLSAKNRDKSNTRLKIEWEKQDKEYKMQIAKLRKQNQRLREDARRANKSNQQNICSYQSYIKQLESQRDKAESKNKQYGEQLKFCIIWMIQAFSMAQNQKLRQNLIQNKLGKIKMRQVFKKLLNSIQDLQLQKNLLQIAKNQQKNNEQYLIYQKEQVRNKQKPKEQPQDEVESIDQFNQMLDTFDLHRYHERKDSDLEMENIARRLFVNEDTFGEEIGQHSISHGYNDFSQQKAVIQSTQQLNGTVVKAKRQIKYDSDDYLCLKKDDQIKLLRKVGGLWIAEQGCRIGYVTQEIFM